MPDWNSRCFKTLESPFLPSPIPSCSFRLRDITFCVGASKRRKEQKTQDLNDVVFALLLGSDSVSACVITVGMTLISVYFSYAPRWLVFFIFSGEFFNACTHIFALRFLYFFPDILRRGFFITLHGLQGLNYTWSLPGVEFRFSSPVGFCISLWRADEMKLSLPFALCDRDAHRKERNNHRVERSFSEISYFNVCMCTCTRARVCVCVGILARLLWQGGVKTYSDSVAMPVKKQQHHHRRPRTLARPRRRQ